MIDVRALLTETIPEYPFVWDLPLLPLTVLEERFYLDRHPLLREIGAAPLSLLSFWQTHRCGVCGDAGDLVLDHDHGSGLVRGYLCRSCNAGEGVGWGGAWELWRLIPAARLLGLQPMRYIGFGQVAYE